MEESALQWEAAARILEILTIKSKVLEIRPGASEWELDVIKHLDTRKLLHEKLEVRKIKNKTTCFALTDEVLYK